jgi:hypothetical protein
MNERVDRLSACQEDTLRGGLAEVAVKNAAQVVELTGGVPVDCHGGSLAEAAGSFSTRGSH